MTTRASQTASSLGRTIRFRTFAYVTAFLALVLVAAASATAGQQAAAKGPIKVMSISADQNSIANFPENWYAAKAYASMINLRRVHGVRGINGAQLQIITCDTKQDANLVEDCARQAVADKVAAVVGFSVGSTRAWPILEAAKIPWIMSSSSEPADSVSPASFPITSAALQQFAMASYAGRIASCKKIAIVNQAGPQPDGLTVFMQKALAAVFKSAGRIAIPPTATDYAGFAAQLRGYDCMIQTLGTTAEIIPLYTAMQAQGVKVKIISQVLATPPAVLQSFPDLLEGAVLFSNYQTTDQPVWKTYLAEMGRYFPQATPSQLTSNQGNSAWVAMVVFDHVASKLKVVNNNTMWAALRSRKYMPVSTDGLTKPLDFSTESPISGLNRTFNGWQAITLVHNGQLVSIKKVSLNYLPLFAKVLSK